uniref:Centrosomal protein of 78 kDa n=1 Tax=Hydra vulgaris TaxID=6087 RepID=T2MCM4_HYDVU
MNQTQKRQQKEDFGFEYERLCAQFSCCPSSRVTANLKDYKLDFNGDRIGLKEWEPLLCSIKVNKSLKTISIKSVKQPTEGNKLVKKKVAAIRSKEITIKLARALKDCLENSQCLECLVLQNIPFREQDVYILAKGLENSKSLKHLSFEKSKIGDTLFKVICKSIKSSQTLVSINVSGCGLTWKSAEDLASIIKVGHRDGDDHNEYHDYDNDHDGDDHNEHHDCDNNHGGDDDHDHHYYNNSYYYYN